MAAKTTLYFHIPLVGRVSTTLYEESAEIYQWLEEEEEIARLKQLDHLGAIRLAWEGAHHPRWEYIMFFLSLVDRCKETPKAHLSSRVALLGSETCVSSASELLKCWALMLNTGHLDGTFATERALLLEVRHNREAREELLDVFADDQDLLRECKKIIEQGDVYRFFHILAFWRLAQKAQKASLNVNWKEILRSYIVPAQPRTALEKLQRLYGNLRRAAYLALDPHYTPSTARLDPLKVATDPEAIAELAIQKDVGTRTYLDAVEQHMYLTIYLSEPVIRAIAEREDALRLTIKESLQQNHHIGLTIEHLATGEIQLREHKNLNTVVRVPLGFNSQFSHLIGKYLNACKLHETINKEAKSGTIAVWATARNDAFIIQAHTEREHTAERAAAYKAVFRFHQELAHKIACDFKRIPNVLKLIVYRSLFEHPAADLLLAALDLISNMQIPVRWEWDPPFEGPIALLAPRNIIHSMIADTIKNGGPRDQIAEMRAIADRIRNPLVDDEHQEHQVVAASLGRIKAVNADSGQVHVEIDGCLIEADGDSLEITIIEAKGARRGAERQARTQLSSSIMKLTGKNYSDIAHKRVEKGNFALAWKTFSL